MRGVSVPNPGAEAWAAVLASVIDESHVVTGDQVAAVVHRAVRPVGIAADVLIVDLAQRVLSPVRPEPAGSVQVEGTAAGQAYQTGEIVAVDDADDGRSLWVPMLNGTERAGLLWVGLGPDVADDEGLRRRVWTLAGLVGHVVMSKVHYSDRLRQLRNGRPLSVASELMWQLLPPRTFASDRAVVTALLEPCAQVAGDAYDYAVDDHTVDIAVYDGLGHDLAATQVTALAMTAVRNARRSGAATLLDLAAAADDVLMAQPGPTRFVTAVLARLDARTGVLSHLLAGHPPPLLFRGGRMVRELSLPPRPPLGVALPGGLPAAVGHEQLEPGDRVLVYSDGIPEARDAEGEFFGEELLVTLVERAERDRQSAPETLRRLVRAVLAHQDERLQDDATLLMIDWTAAGSSRIFPGLG